MSVGTSKVGGKKSALLTSREGKNLHGPGGVMQSRVKASEATKAVEKATAAHQPGAKLREAHKVAGEAHIAAAMSMEHPHRETKEAIEHHLAKAVEHAKAAGSAWDDAKHPRDENGKFV